MTQAHFGIVVSLLVALSVTPAAGQTRSYSDAALLVRPAEYFGATYAAPPERAAYLFFTSESLRVQIDVVNRGSSIVELTRPAAAAQSFRVTSQGPASQFVLEPEVTKKGLGAPTRVESSSMVSLAPGESLVFFASRTGPALPPGEYVVEWTTTITEVSGLKVAPQASRLQFEVRESSTETAAEEARRNAIRAFVAGQDTLADRWTTQLLRVNPESYAAHVLRAELSLRAGDKTAAATAFDAALDILERHADQQYNRWAHDALTRDTINGIKSRRRSEK